MFFWFGSKSVRTTFIGDVKILAVDHADNMIAKPQSKIRPRQAFGPGLSVAEFNLQIIAPCLQDVPWLNLTVDFGLFERSRKFGKMSLIEAEIDITYGHFRVPRVRQNGQTAIKYWV